MSKKKIISKIAGYFLNIIIVIVVIIILIGIYYIFQIKILKNEYSDLFGYTFFEVATGSMSNTIEIGDVVIVKITKDVEENDIIVYRDKENFITHRLISKQADKLIAKGDANNSEDKPITNEQILGEVIQIVPQVGIWKKVIFTPEIILLVVAVIILIGFITSYTSKKDKDAKE